MRITICDRSFDPASIWPQHICPATCVHGSILEIACDAVVSPANSFGFMDGGVDYAYSSHFGWQVQGWLQDQLKLLPFGELLVGQALMIPTANDTIPYLISAPTMRVPKVITDVADIFLATRAAARMAKDAGLSHIAFPGMGTGCGQVSANVAMHAMAKGIAAALNVSAPPSSWQEAQRQHFALPSPQQQEMK